MTQIDFVPVILARLSRGRFLEAGEKAGLRVLLSNPDGPALRRPYDIVLWTYNIVYTRYRM